MQFCVNTFGMRLAFFFRYGCHIFHSSGYYGILLSSRYKSRDIFNRYVLPEVVRIRLNDFYRSFIFINPWNYNGYSGHLCSFSGNLYFGKWLNLIGMPKLYWYQYERRRFVSHLPEKTKLLKFILELEDIRRFNYKPNLTEDEINSAYRQYADFILKHSKKDFCRVYGDGKAVKYFQRFDGLDSRLSKINNGDGGCITKGDNAYGGIQMTDVRNKIYKSALNVKKIELNGRDKFEKGLCWFDYDGFLRKNINTQRYIIECLYLKACGYVHEQCIDRLKYIRKECKREYVDFYSTDVVRKISSDAQEYVVVTDMVLGLNENLYIQKYMFPDCSRIEQKSQKAVHLIDTIKILEKKLKNELPIDIYFYNCSKCLGRILNICKLSVFMVENILNKENDINLTHISDGLHIVIKMLRRCGVTSLELRKIIKEYLYINQIIHSPNYVPSLKVSVNQLNNNQMIKRPAVLILGLLNDLNDIINLVKKLFFEVFTRLNIVRKKKVMIIESGPLMKKHLAPGSRVVPPSSYSNECIEIFATDILKLASMFFWATQKLAQLFEIVDLYFLKLESKMHKNIVEINDVYLIKIEQTFKQFVERDDTQNILCLNETEKKDRYGNDLVKCCGKNENMNILKSLKCSFPLRMIANIYDDKFLFILEELNKLHYCLEIKQSIRDMTLLVSAVEGHFYMLNALKKKYGDRYLWLGWVYPKIERKAEQIKHPLEHNHKMTDLIDVTESTPFVHVHGPHCRINACTPASDVGWGVRYYDWDVGETVGCVCTRYLMQLLKQIASSTTFYVTQELRKFKNLMTEGDLIIKKNNNPAFLLRQMCIFLSALGRILKIQQLRLPAAVGLRQVDKHNREGAINVPLLSLKQRLKLCISYVYDLETYNCRFLPFNDNGNNDAVICLNETEVGDMRLGADKIKCMNRLSDDGKDRSVYSQSLSKNIFDFFFECSCWLGSYTWMLPYKANLSDRTLDIRNEQYTYESDLKKKTIEIRTCDVVGILHSYLLGGFVPMSIVKNVRNFLQLNELVCSRGNWPMRGNNTITNNCIGRSEVIKRFGAMKLKTNKSENNYFGCLGNEVHARDNSCNNQYDLKRSNVQCKQNDKYEVMYNITAQDAGLLIWCIGQCKSLFFLKFPIPHDAGVSKNYSTYQVDSLKYRLEDQHLRHVLIRLAYGVISSNLYSTSLFEKNSKKLFAKNEKFYSTNNYRSISKCNVDTQAVANSVWGLACCGALTRRFLRYFLTTKCFKTFKIFSNAIERKQLKQAFLLMHLHSIRHRKYSFSNLLQVGKSKWLYFLKKKSGCKFRHPFNYSVRSRNHNTYKFSVPAILWKKNRHGDLIHAVNNIHSNNISQHSEGVRPSKLQKRVLECVDNFLQSKGNYRDLLQKYLLFHEGTLRCGITLDGVLLNKRLKNNCQVMFTNKKNKSRILTCLHRKKKHINFNGIGIEVDGPSHAILSATCKENGEFELYNNKNLPNFFLKPSGSCLLKSKMFYLLNWKIIRFNFIEWQVIEEMEMEKKLNKNEDPIGDGMNIQFLDYDNIPSLTNKSVMYKKCGVNVPSTHEELIKNKLTESGIFVE